MLNEAWVDFVFANFAISVVVWIIMGTIGGRMFAYRGYPPILGIAVGLIFGPIWLAVCWFLPMTNAARTAWKTNRATEKAGASSKACPQCERTCGGMATFCPACHHRFD